jgi:RecA/RadA recombinase
MVNPAPKKKPDLASIVEKTQALYKKDAHGAAMIATGDVLKRPTEPDQFVLAPEGHPWRELTGLLGLPYDSIIQIAGAYDSGKSTIAGEFMAFAQQQGVYVILGDAEKKFDKDRFEKHFGGNAKELLVVQSTIISKLAGGIFKYINVIKEQDPTAKILVIHDSIGGSVSKARANREIDDEKANQPGSEAVENSDYMKHMVATIDRYPGSIVTLLINQMTDKIGFGQKGQSRSGGHKISFHSSMILEAKKIKTLTKTVNKVVVKTGIITKIKIDKNHLSQTENSVSEMNIMVNVKGWHKTDFTFDKDEG